MIFVDTGAWFASVIPSDPNHAAANAWLVRNQKPLLTTDYVIDETLTLLKARGHYLHALALGDKFFHGDLTIHFLTEADIFAAWQVFRKFHDKAWSFTDYASKVVMEKIGLGTAFAFDPTFASSA